MPNQAARLQRQTLRTSRLLDFCSEKELVAQTGHEREIWPLVVLKELADNALDACENQGISPVLTVGVDHTGISVADNGPGLPSDVVADVLDFAVRVSDKEHYVSPTRGAQGNALKTLVTMPYVLHGEHGRVTIAARGIRHEINMRVDRIRQKLLIDRQQHTDKKVKRGTRVHVHWPRVCMGTLTSSKKRFLQIAEDYTFLNPHLALSVDWFGERTRTQATTVRWNKWLPSDPTSAHWYDRQRFERLVAGYIADDADRGQDRLVREFLWTFSGMSSTAKHKAVLQATGLARVNLSAFQKGNEIDHERTHHLLEALKAHSKPIKAKALGTIGREHLAARFQACGCRMESFAYRKVSADKNADGLPCVLETAFAWRPSSNERRLVTGVNWSPGIGNLFRQIGRFGESLDAILQKQKLGWDAEAVFVLHVARPRVDYTDRGKSAVVIGGDAYHGEGEDQVLDSRTIIGAVRAVTRKWAKQVKREERDRNARLRREEALTRSFHSRVSLKEAVFREMQAGIAKASGGGRTRYPQKNLHYSIRELIQKHTAEKLTYGYFQQVLRAWEAEHGPAPGKYCDPRGYFVEPHTGTVIPLGTREVESYAIPPWRYDKILYVEKKGFHELFKIGRIAERYDIGIICAEGYAPDAAKLLLARAEQASQMTILCMHDADPDGYNIPRCLRNATRIQQTINVIDIGLKLQEALDMDLDVEEFLRERALPQGLELDDLEREYFGGVPGRRVELNSLAADPDKFIRYVEQKLEEHGCADKLVPPPKVVLERAKAMRIELLQEAARKKLAELLNEDGLVRALSQQFADKVIVKDLPRVLTDWAHELEPQSWDKYVEEQIKERIEALAEELDEQVLARMRAVAAGL